jgi:hypothetical protein
MVMYYFKCVPKKAVNAVGITKERFGLHYKLNKIVLLVAK